MYPHTLENHQNEKRGVITIPKKNKLNFRFHNPNTPEITADYIAQVFVAANQKKIEDILKERAYKDEHDKARGGDRYLA